MRASLNFSRHPIVWVAVLVALSATLVFGPAPAAAGERAGAAAGLVTSVTPIDSWEWPTAPPRPILRPFEAPPTPYAAGHRGIDVAATPGTAVRSPADGLVSFAGVVVDRPVLSIRHADGLVSSIEPVTPGVSAGDAVTAGQPVGVVARDGHCDSRCVHFGVRLYGEYVNPLALLSKIERAVLLPLGR